jgi:hypothetical protein
VNYGAVAASRIRGEQIEDDEMSKTCSMRGKTLKYVRDFYLKTFQKDVTGEAKT